jgi:hypothetical protein
VQLAIDTLLDDRAVIHKPFEALTVAVRSKGVDTRKAIQLAAGAYYEKRVMLGLLESLRFDTMTLRHEAIADAH